MNGGEDRLSAYMNKIWVVEDEDVLGERSLCESLNSGDASESSDLVCLSQAVPRFIKKEEPDDISLIEELPILQKKAELLEALLQNQVLIVVGETGTGKTTKIPQFLYEIGVADRGRIGCTQLRRAAVKKMAERVALELDCTVGEVVGYSVRFDDHTSPSTRIQFMTDGILLNEATFDRTLSTYSAIILDEAHERNLETDVLLGLLRWAALEARKDLKLVISSATLDEKKFAHFFNAPVFHINGRMFPVEEIYCPFSSSYEDYIGAAASKVRQLNELGDSEPGDILVFMTGQGDITKLCEDLDEYVNSSSYPELCALPYYSTLSPEEQARVFEPTEKGKRKVIVATNIAETSLTLDNIRYVIDSGWVKQKTYDHRHRMEIIKKTRISRAQAIQRAGRAGRVAPGQCYRLYSEYDFWMFASGPEPEIKRSTLVRAVLMLKNMNFDDLSVFHFIDPPPTGYVQIAEEELRMLGAIDANGIITNTGQRMASFAVEPYLAKMLITSESLNCSEEILTIVALLSVPDIFIQPIKNKREEATNARADFASRNGDLLTILNVYNEWLANDKDIGWCEEKFINSRFIFEASQIKTQLQEAMSRQNMSIKSLSDESDSSPILKSICSGLILNVATLTVGGIYLTREKDRVFIHPGSVLFHKPKSCVVYQKIIYTNRSWMIGVTPVEKEWIDHFTPSFCPFPTNESDDCIIVPDNVQIRPMQRKRRLLY